MKKLRLDDAPLVLLTAAVFAVAEAGALSRLRTSLPLGIAGVMLLLGSALTDRQAQHRVFPHQMLDMRTKVGQGLLMVFALSAGTTAFWAYGPLVLNVAFGIDPLVSGIMMAVESLLWSLCTILVATRASNPESFFIRVGVSVASREAPDSQLPCRSDGCRVLHSAWGCKARAMA